MPYKYTGKEYDPETKLTYYGARYYDAKLSRWISVDPPLISGEYLPSLADKLSLSAQGKQYKPEIDLPGMGGVYNPINLNAYAYGGNNPVKYIDPDGKFIGKAFQMLFNWGTKKVAKTHHKDKPYEIYNKLNKRIDKKYENGDLSYKEYKNEKARIRIAKDLSLEMEYDKKNGVAPFNKNKTIKDKAIDAAKNAIPIIPPSENEYYKKQAESRFEIYKKTGIVPRPKKAIDLEKILND
jgi:uncharacterized protein RhaS with RHS repeats